MKIGIIKEYKQPADRRVVLTPRQCRHLMDNYPNITVKVQSSDDRTFADEEYKNLGIELTNDISDCDIMLGVKEVPPEKLIEGKTYFFFSHTIKKQPYNQGLMKALLAKKIRMIDFETLTHSDGKRIIGFGNFAGKIGSYNGLLTWGKKHGSFDLERAYVIDSYKGIIEETKQKLTGNIKIVLAGTGRVGKGALKFLNDIGLEKISPEEFLKTEKKGIYFTHLGSKHLYQRKIGGGFSREEFHKSPELYESTFHRFYNKTDLLINGIFWTEKMPAHFKKEDISKKDFRISVISDISCDVEGSVPITYKVVDIYNPVFGVDRQNYKETKPYLENTVDMMTVTNLPTELAKDSSLYFGKTFIQKIIPEIVSLEVSEILDRATICRNGKLNKGYEYLSDFAGLV